MPTELTTKASDQSTYVVVCAFTDEDGDAVTPKTLTWTLTDGSGTVVNSREDVSVSTPSSTESVVMSGDDLNPSVGQIRIFTVEGTYDSSLGNDLPLKGSAIFYLEDLEAV